MYFAHAGHQHLTEQAAKTHNDQTAMVVVWSIAGVVLVATFLYAIYMSRAAKKPSSSKNDLK